MDTVVYVLSILMWVLCPAIIGLILLQGAAGDISSSFGGGGQLDASLGVGAHRKMAQVTGVLAFLFFIMVLVLAYPHRGSFQKMNNPTPAPAALPAPAAPAVEAKPAEAVPAAQPTPAPAVEAKPAEPTAQPSPAPAAEAKPAEPAAQPVPAPAVEAKPAEPAVQPAPAPAAEAKPADPAKP